MDKTLAMLLKALQGSVSSIKDKLHFELTVETFVTWKPPEFDGIDRIESDLFSNEMEKFLGKVGSPNILGAETRVLFQ